MFAAIFRWRQEWPLLVALAFDNGLADHKSAFKRLNGNNPATSYTNLVSFRPVISEFMLLKRAIFAPIRLQLDDDPKRIEKLQVWFQQSNQQTFLYIW